MVNTSVTIRIKSYPGKRNEILLTLSEILAQVKQKKGCLDAMGYQAIDDENVFYLVEEWKTKKDMDEYMNSKLFAALLGAKSILVEKPEVKILVGEDLCNNTIKDKKNITSR